MSRRHGYHRDELFFLSAGHHPAWGYPDQPPLTPILAWLMDAAWPGSLLAFRMPSALAAGGVIVLSALVARELGGGRFAQVITALAVGLGVITLLAGHLLSTATFDYLTGVTLSFLVVRILRTGRQRLWLIAGVVAGIGLLNKDLPLFLLAGLAIGALLTPQARPQLADGWLWAGAATAALIWSPYLVWQARHGWPQLELAGDIRAEYAVLEERLNYLLLQVVMFSLGATVLWVWGLVRLWRHPGWRIYRVLAWAWLVLLLFFLFAGKGYYLAGLYPALIAAGALGVGSRLPKGRWVILFITAAVSPPSAFDDCRLAARIDAGEGIDNEEQGGHLCVPGALPSAGAPLGHR